MKRTGVVAVALAFMMALSGCAFLTGGPLEFAASKATVSDQAQQSAGYEEVSVEAQNRSQSFSAAGQERDVKLTNWVATYERDLGIATSSAPGSVVVLSTPTVSIAGQTLNPLGSMSHREVLNQVLQQYGGLSDVEERDTKTMTVLGEDSEVTTFSANADYEGVEVPVLVHLTTVEHEGDIVVAIAVHPEMLSEDQVGVETMFGGIEHDGD